jgi:chorismate dehydratase
MIFGKIDYINLLPFHVFLKRYPMTNALKKACEHKKSYPSAINKKFRKRAVGGAVISSIESARKGVKTLPLGIVAQKNVKSVIIKKDTKSATDPQSATSNILAKVLKIEGQVLIGDKALKAYLNAPDEYIDLALEWNKKHKLPFVFARLSINSHLNTYKKISDSFKNNRIKIPAYILSGYAQERGISPKDIKEYLKLISYKIEKKEQLGLKLFLKKAKHIKR